MANTINIQGTPYKLTGKFIKQGDVSPSFKLVRKDFTELCFDGKANETLLLNIFPSIDTGVCANSVRKFNELAAKIPNVKVLCISKDLPFAQSRFCATEGIKNVETLSDFRDNSFAKDYGVGIAEGPLKGLLARAIIIITKDGKILYSALNYELTKEPDYKEALNVLK